MTSAHEIQRIANEYEAEGYAVIVHPGADQLPPFAHCLRADIVARRGTEGVIVSVFSDRADLMENPPPSAAVDAVNAQPGWRFDLVIASAIAPERQAGFVEPTMHQINDMLAESEHVLSLGSARSAFLLAWAGLEAAMRRVGQRAAIGGRIGTGPTTLARELYSAGLVTRDELRSLDEVIRIRNLTAHGLAPAEVSEAMVLQLIDLAKKLLAESEHVQPAVA